jgi:hypothetical protein
MMKREGYFYILVCRKASDKEQGYIYDGSAPAGNATQL